MSTARTFTTGLAGAQAMTLLGTATVAGAAATTITMSGLDLSAYKGFLVLCKFENATASAATLSLYYNADTTNTNYDNQRNVFTTSAAVARSNDGFIFSMAASGEANATLTIQNNVDGKPSAECRARENVTTSIQGRLSYHHWRTAANVTGITFSSSVASSFAIGSTFTVYGIL